MRKFCMLLIVPFLMACASTYQSTSIPEFSDALQVGTPAGRLYYPNYRLPQKPYYEIGTFDFAKPVRDGKPDNFLTDYLKKHNLDGAIIIDRQRVWHEFTDRYVEYEHLTYVAIVFEERVRESEWLSKVRIDRYLNEELFLSSEIELDMLGQQTKISGSAELLHLALRVQPWYFLKQAGPLWQHKNANLKPNVRQYMGLDRYRFWEVKELEPLVVYRHSTIDWQRFNIVMEPIGENLVTKAILYSDRTETVESLFLVDQLKKQVWQRPALNEKIVFTYSYTSMHEQDELVLIEP